MDYTIRPILAGEVGLLQDFLYEAIFVSEGLPAPPKSIINQPELQVYITGFGTKKDDIGLAAEIDNNPLKTIPRMPPKNLGGISLFLTEF